MDENVKTFSLCSNQRKLISRMNAEQKAELLDALFAFNDGEEVSVDDPLVDTVFMVMTETIERMRKFAAQKKANGQKGGRPKGDNNQDNDDGENTHPNESKNNQNKPSETKNNQNESNANQEKPQYQYQYQYGVKELTPPLPPSGGNGERPAPYSQEFETFWTAYPKKTGKDGAWRAWKNKKREKRLPPVPDLVAKVEHFRQTDQWQRDGGQYIPNPATWLNQCRWLDEEPQEEKAHCPMAGLWEDD